MPSGYRLQSKASRGPNTETASDLDISGRLRHAQTYKLTTHMGSSDTFKELITCVLLSSLSMKRIGVNQIVIFRLFVDEILYCLFHRTYFTCR